MKNHEYFKYWVPFPFKELSILNTESLGTPNIAKEFMSRVQNLVLAKCPQRKLLKPPFNYHCKISYVYIDSYICFL